VRRSEVMTLGRGVERPARGSEGRCAIAEFVPTQCGPSAAARPALDVHRPFGEGPEDRFREQHEIVETHHDRVSVRAAVEHDVLFEGE